MVYGCIQGVSGCIYRAYRVYMDVHKVYIGV